MLLAISAWLHFVGPSRALWTCAGQSQAHSDRTAAGLADRRAVGVDDWPLPSPGSRGHAGVSAPADDLAVVLWGLPWMPWPVGLIGAEGMPASRSHRLRRVGIRQI